MTVPSHAVSGWRDGWYVVPYEVMWRDVDAAGHVNNAVYFSFFEWGRTRYWLDLQRSATIGDINFIVAHARCDFRRELNLADRIEIAVRVSDMRRSSFDFESVVRRSNGGDIADIAAQGVVTLVLYSFEERQKLLIPDDLRERVRRFQEGEGTR